MADGFTKEERAAMKERAAELRAEAKRAKLAEKAEADLADLLAKIDSMPEPDRGVATRLHELALSVAPELEPKLYYGQPGYALGGKVVVFFRSGLMDKERYSTFGVSSRANLDDASGIWPTSYAIAEPTEAAWKAIEEIIKQAVAG